MVAGRRIGYNGAIILAEVVMEQDPLEPYRDKRRAHATPEPSGQGQDQRRPRSAGKRPIFAIQKHDASTQHYDFRLEIGGVLKSWAVPKGPSTDPREKRLAVETEDHPLDYADFEGVIPASEYGGGTVMVWDIGPYDNAKIDADGHAAKSLADCWADGHLTINLHGDKIYGGYALTHFRTEGGKRQWLLVKINDEYADARRHPVATEDHSVISGRTSTEIAHGREAANASKIRIEERLKNDDSGHARKAAMPRTFEPMLATLHDTPFSDERWLYERKFDGIRLLVFRDGENVELYTRNGKLRNSHFPELVDLFAAQPGQRFVLDGEVVAFDGKVTSFARLQQRAGMADPDAARASGIAIHFYVFDSPWIEGYDIRCVPLRQRKAVIRDVLDYSGRLRFTAHRNGDGEAMLNEARAKGWEGIIAKQADSAYRTGRSRRWLKLKCQAGQELVIGGYTDPEGERTGFGALLVGYYETGELRYAGRVGTGFTEKELTRLHRVLAASERKKAPFADPPDEPGIHWVAPERVAEIEFTEWTADGKLRHPAYLGERDDKDPYEVVRETSGT